MPFPIVQASAESATATAGTSHVINLPSGIGQRDLVIIFFGHAVSCTLDALAGWTELVDTNAANAEKILYRYCDGSEGASITLTSSASTKSATLAWRISGGLDPATQAPQLSTVATGTSTQPNATTCTPTGGAKDYLWITAFVTAGEEADDDTWGGAAPTNYANALYKTSGTAGTAATNCSVAGAYRTNNAASEDAGAWGANAQSLAWRAWTIAVHPAPPIWDDESSTGFRQLAVQPPAAQPIVDTEEVAPQAVPSTVDDDTNWTPASQLTIWAATAFRDDEEIPSMGGSGGIGTLIVLTTTVPPPIQILGDEELAQAPAAAALDDEAVWKTCYESMPWSPAAFADDEILIPLANFASEQEEPWLAAYQTTSWSPKAYSDDETSAQLKNFPLEQEEPWTAAYLCVSWSPVAFTYDEILAPLANFAREQEEPWTAAFVGVSWSPVAFTYDEILSPLANFAREQEDFWPAAVQSGGWAPAAFRDDEWLSFTPAPSARDDDAFVPGPIVVTWRPVAWLADEELSPLKNFAREQEEPWIARQTAHAWTPAIVSDHEDFARFVLEEPDVWVTRQFAYVWTPATLLHDAEEATRFVLDEPEPWSAGRGSLAWSAITATDQDELPPQTPFGLDEDPWQAPPAAGRLLSYYAGFSFDDEGVPEQVVITFATTIYLSIDLPPAVPIAFSASAPAVQIANTTNVPIVELEK